MNWPPWRTSRDDDTAPSPGRDTEAQRAQERARLADRQAAAHLEEMNHRVAKSRKELAANNFAGDIWQAMKRRPS